MPPLEDGIEDVDPIQDMYFEKFGTDGMDLLRALRDAGFENNHKAMRLACIMQHMIEANQKRRRNWFSKLFRS